MFYGTIRDMKPAGSGVGELSSYFGLGHTLLSSAEKARLLAKMAKARDEKRPKAFRRYRAKVVEIHLRFALSLVRRYSRASVPQEDLLNVAAIGLMRACDSYDPKRKVAFSTFSAWWVLAKLGREIGNFGRTIRTPIHRQQHSHTLFSATARFESLNGRAPTEKELALATGLSLKKVRRLAIDGAALPIASLDAPISSHGETQGTLLDVLQSPAPSPEDTFQEHEDSAKVSRLLACLPAKERAVITMRMGLDGSKPRTLSEVGAVFGFSRERSRQLESQALDRMRRAAKFMNQDSRPRTGPKLQKAM